MNLLPLHLLGRGESAQIGQLIGKMADIHRLAELGLRDGVKVEMLQPGSPCVIRVADDQKLCVRGNDTSGIFVRAGGYS